MKGRLTGNHSHNMRKYFLLISRCFTCSLVTCKYPKDSLIIPIVPILPATYLSPPCLLPLWCYKITWLYSYMSTTIIPWLTCKMLQKRARALSHARTHARAHTHTHTGSYLLWYNISWQIEQTRRTYAMPPCSPNLTPLDCRPWGFAKDVVYIYLRVAAE